MALGYAVAFVSVIGVGNCFYEVLAAAIALRYYPWLSKTWTHLTLRAAIAQRFLEDIDEMADGERTFLELYHQGRCTGQLQFRVDGESKPVEERSKKDIQLIEQRKRDMTDRFIEEFGHDFKVLIDAQLKSLRASYERFAKVQARENIWVEDIVMISASNWMGAQLHLASDKIFENKTRRKSKTKPFHKDTLQKIRENETKDLKEYLHEELFASQFRPINHSGKTHFAEGWCDEPIFISHLQQIHFQLIVNASVFSDEASHDGGSKRQRMV